MNLSRALLAGLALIALLWLMVRLFGPTTGDQEGGVLAFRSSAECAACHQDVYDEWQLSSHAKSWIGEEVRRLSNDFANTDCIDCHAPQPVFVTGIGQRVMPRATRRVEGVDCITCHALPDGGVAATRDVPEAPCRPTLKLELSSPDFCAGCHNQHETVDQWRASRFAAEGIGCIDCHMPHHGGDPSRPRSHASLGGADIEMVRAAITLTAEREDGAWVVFVENVGAGHSFPTDERSRAADLFWRPLDPAGEPEGGWRHLYRFRDPYRHEVDLWPTLLMAHERRAVPLTDGPRRFFGSGGREDGTPVSGPAEVALFYKRTPYYSNPDAPDPEGEARLVHRIRLEP